MSVSGQSNSAEAVKAPYTLDLLEQEELIDLWRIATSLPDATTEYDLLAQETPSTLSQTAAKLAIHHETDFNRAIITRYNNNGPLSVDYWGHTAQGFFGKVALVSLDGETDFFTWRHSFLKPHVWRPGEVIVLANAEIMHWMSAPKMNPVRHGLFFGNAIGYKA